MTATAATRGRAADIGVADVLRIALPMTLGYLTTPLVGLVATGAVGRLGDAAALGGVALGSVVIDLVFAAFAFLRAGTTGLVAQAHGRGDEAETWAVAARALFVAFVCGAGLLVLARPIVDLGLLVVGGEPAVAAATRAYVETRLLAAPLILANQAIFGWCLGRGRAGLALFLQTTLNLVNIAGALTFTVAGGDGVVGVARASVLAETVAFVAAVTVTWPRLRRAPRLDRRRILDLSAFRTMAVVDRDLTIRTVVLLTAFAFFSRQSAAQGAVVLAANGILEKFFLTASYFLDGLAAAAEIFVGRAVGARDRAAFDRALRLTLILSAGAALAAGVVLAASGPTRIGWMTTRADVIATASRHLLWVVVTPLAGCLAFQMDGVYIGATWTRDMARMMVLSLVFYFAAWALLTPLWGNHGLWAAFVGFLGIRGVTLARLVPARAKATFARS